MFFFRSRFFFFFFFWNDSKITRLGFGLNIFNQRIIIRLAAYHSSWRIAPSTMSFCQASDRAWWVIIDDQPRQRVVQAIADTLSSLPVNREDTSSGSIDFLCISINLLDVISRAFTSEIPRRREMEKNEKEFLRRLNDESVTFKGNRLSNRINSNASFFFFFFPSPSYLLPSRGDVSSTRIVIRRPGRNDSANGLHFGGGLLASSHAKTDKGEERGKEKNNYTVCESISMKVVRRPSIERILRNQVPIKIHSFHRTRARNYRVPRKTWMELGIL